MTPPKGVARQWPGSARMRSCTATTNGSVNQSGMVAPSDAQPPEAGDQLARRDPLRAPVQRADDPLDCAHVVRGVFHRRARAVVHVGQRLAGREVAPEAGRQPRLALDRVVQEVVQQIAARLALHGLPRPRRASMTSLWRSSVSFSNRMRMSGRKFTGMARSPRG